METEFKANEAFKKAQEYELRCNNHFAETDKDYQEGSKKLLEQIEKYKNTGEITPFEEWPLWTGIHHEFFKGSVEEFNYFIEKIKDKTSLEVGSGPCGLLNVLYQLKSRIFIEPLLDGYRKKQLSLLGKTWFSEDVICYSQPAEILIPELIGKIDGMIICRNCIDHTQDWKYIMNNISQYASPGCHFLFWADLYHLNGGDDGHFNVTDDKDYFRRYVKDIGFEIHSEWEMPEAERKCINLGFVAKKIK